MMVRPVPSCAPVNVEIPLDSKGVAKEKVVAVAQTMENIAVISIIFPKLPSTFLPSSGRHASEKRCLSRFGTVHHETKNVAKTT